MLVPLQGAAAGCCLKVLLLEWRVRFRAWSAGAAERLRVLLLEWLWRWPVLLQGATAGYCCQSAVCAMKLGYWCQGVAATCQWQCERWALMAITCMP